MSRDQSGESNPNWRDAKETSVCERCGEPFTYYPSNTHGKVCKECSPKDWSDHEIQILKGVYPTDGSKGVSEIIDRSQSSVRSKACKLGVSSSYSPHPEDSIRKEDLPVELECEKCGESYLYDRNTETNTNKCFACHQREKRHARKQMLVEEHGGECHVCGYDECLQSLVFHHVDPDKKEFNVAKNNVLRSFDDVREEAKKCVLLCANCHGQHHCRNCIETFNTDNL